MQTLTAGSFLNFENAANLEALKFTARRLAEHTANVAAAENFNALWLENLANNLWDKAEYVTLDVERRSLREIFLENFRERFRELKPEVTPAQKSAAEILSSASTIGNSGLIDNAPEITEGGKSECATDESAFSVSLAVDADATESQEKRDEFLGFVKTDEPFSATQEVAETGRATTNAPNDAERETVDATNATFSETLKLENKSAAGREATNSESDQVDAGREISAESENNEKSPPATATAAGNNSQPVSANKNGANKTETKEPFEFGKCTVSLNLVLLPSSAGDNKRKAIVSASSHNLPPEIEFLEISEGENLTEIADLVRDKLARFKNTLPAKYIEQLRASKTKSLKKPAPAKGLTSVAAPAKPDGNQTTVEETSEAQSAQNSSGIETEQSRTEITATKETVSALPTTSAVVSQSSAAANNVQPSLF